MAKSESQGSGYLGNPRPQVQSSVPADKPAAKATAAESTRGETAGSNSGPTELPARFGHFRVKKKLGGGGMGTVYLVENTELERDEALKVPHFGDGADPQLRERFLREAKSAAKLHHANLCPVYDAGVQDGIYFLTMRFLEGKPLSAYTGTALPPRKAVEIVTKLAQALEAAHAKGVIHRDLKPSNVMMVSGVGPVVMDFGLAKQVMQPDQKLTQSGSMLGTPSYMPPEQVKGELDKMGPASDVYSLGVILYELLTGRLPFEGTMGVIFGQILYTEAPLPSTAVPGLNPALDGICRKAMAKVPTDRYPSMKSFAAAQMAYLRLAPTTDSGRNVVSASLDGAAIFRPPTAAPVPPPAVKAIPVAIAWSPPTQRFKPSRLLGGGAMLCAALVGAYFLVTIILAGNSEKNDDPPPQNEKDLAPKITPAQNEPLGIKFVKVPRGSFWMGWDSDKKKSKQVTIDQDFELAAYTVTQAQWQEVMGNNPSHFSRQGFANPALYRISEEDLKRFPVENVSWNDIQEFVKKLNEREIGRGWLYRLPSEAEWEYACRGGAASKEECSFDFYLDKPSNDLSWNQANFDGDSPGGNGANGPKLQRTMKVGSYAPNKLGLYDMHGNVWQWCADLYDATGSDRVFRGGSWQHDGQFCRAAFRNRGVPTLRSPSLGFRVARVPSGG